MAHTVKIPAVPNQFSVNCSSCLLGSFCFPVAPSTKISGATNIVKQKLALKRKTLLCDRNDKFDYIYAVREGVLKAYVAENEGRMKIVNFYLPGEILGFEAISDTKYPFAVEALTTTTLCAIPFSNLLAVIAAHPKLQQQIMNLMSKRISMGAYVTYFRAEHRIIGFLIEMAQRLHCKENHIEFVLPISRQDIGDYLGLAEETVSRIINRLHQEGLILANKKSIKIFNLSKLQLHLQN